MTTDIDYSDTIPEPVNEYFSDGEEEVLLLWKNVDYVDDDGDNSPLVIYVAANGRVTALNQNIWKGNFKKLSTLINNEMF